VQEGPWLQGKPNKTPALLMRQGLCPVQGENLQGGRSGLRAYAQWLIHC
jgi:hypothetical protein